jgi:hypothetical protein
MAVETTPKSASRTIVSSGDMELAYPGNPKGIGAVIGRVDSPDLIAGVRVQQYPVFPDDRGFFMEIQRIGHGLASAFPPERTQVAAAMNYCGTIKAFHYHLYQTDCWTPVTGLFQVALVDLRAASPTFGARIQDYRNPGCLAGLYDRSVLQSERRRAARLRRSVDQLRLGDAEEIVRPAREFTIRYEVL